PERLSVEKVVQAINGIGERRAVAIEKADTIASYVAQNAAPNDIVIVMSNGGFDGVQDKILQALAEQKKLSTFPTAEIIAILRDGFIFRHIGLTLRIENHFIDVSWVHETVAGLMGEPIGLEGSVKDVRN